MLVLGAVFSFRSHFCDLWVIANAFLLYQTPDEVEGQVRTRNHPASRFHVETLIICKLGFNQNYYTFALMLLTNIVLYGKFC